VLVPSTRADVAALTHALAARRHAWVQRVHGERSVPALVSFLVAEYQQLLADSQSAVAKQNKFASLEEDEEAEEDFVPQPTQKKPSVVAAVTVPTIDDEPEDAEPLPVPAKKVVTTTAKKVVAKVTAGAKKV
jgi:hypothetical protein